MQAINAHFSTVMGNFQYVIPYFQRSYVWRQEQISRFAEDMLYVSQQFTLQQQNNPQIPFEYFMGTIISKSGSTGNGYSQLELIDGQQRVTTFAIFFKVMSLVYGDPTIFDNQFKFSYGFPNTQWAIKLQSSAVDQPYLDMIINLSTDTAIDKNGLPLPPNKKWSKRAMPNMYVAYNMFRDYLIDLKNKGTFINPYNIANGVQFINMTLNGNDDAQVYFDNINSLGVRLSTSAIIKNYIFTHNPVGYNSYLHDWEPMFEAGTNFKYWNGDGTKGNIDDFLFYYLLVKTYDPNMGVSHADKLIFSRRDSIANHIKELCGKYMSNNKNSLLSDIKQYATTYQKVFVDNIGSVVTLGKKATIDDRLARVGYLMKKLKVTTLMPYVLYVANNTANTSDTLDILNYLESYLIRRSLFDANVDNYNKFFRETLVGKGILTLVDLKKELDPSNNRSTDMPSDLLILSQINNWDYQGDNETPKAILFMYEHVLSIRNQAHVTPLSPDSYTLEHLMPQTLNPHWLGANWSEDRIYKIGNMGLLTQSLQSSIKNLPWNTKLNGNGNQPGIKQSCSGLNIMASVVSKTSWDDNEIDARTLSIITDLISIWKA